MKKLLYLIFVLAVAVLVVPATTQAEMLVNGSFEDSGDGWSSWGSGSGSGSGGYQWYSGVASFISDGTAYDGDYYMQNHAMDAYYSSLWGWGWNCAWQDERMPVTEGETYTLSAYTRNGADDGLVGDPDDPDEGPALLRIEWYDNNGNEPDFDGDGVTSNDDDDRTTRYYDIDNEWSLISTTETCPPGWNIVQAQVVIGTAWNAVYVDFDQAWFGLAGNSPYSGDPVPTNGDSVSHNNLTELRWTKPTPLLPGGTVTCDIYLDPNSIRVKDMNPISRLNESPQEPNSIAVTVEEGKVYYWRIVSFDNDGEGPVETPGVIWNFTTQNAAPVVNAGFNQAVWLSGGLASVDLAGVITDDGLPDPPDNISYSWAKTSGPAALVSNSDPCGTVPGNGKVATTVEFDTAGTYVITLSADDEPTASNPPGLGLTSSDTVTVYVYASDHTGLIAYWPFDGFATQLDDVAGGSHHGTAVGNPAYKGGVYPKLGTGCMYFDGEGSYIDITDSGTTDPNLTTWASPPDPNTVSVMCWIKTEGLANDEWAGIVHKGAAGGTGDIYDAWQLQFNSSSDDVEFKPGGSNTQARMGDAGSAAIKGVNDNKWHHLAGVFAGDVMSLYVDGILADIAEADFDVQHGIHNIWIGAGYNYGSPDAAYEFEGYIDEVRLYDVPLSAEKVLQQFIDDGGYNSCGGNYAPTDLNQDCYVTVEDLAIFAGRWMFCNDVTNPQCD